MLIPSGRFKRIVVRVKDKKPLFLLPNFITFLNAIFGFLSIIKSINYEYNSAALYIVFASFLDACDGRLARAIGFTSYFGMELDSLSDAISFCLAPIILLYTWFNINSYFSTFILIFYFCAGLARLAKFNSQANSGNLKEFTGLPTPIGALLISLIILQNNWFFEHSLSFLVSRQTLTVLVAVIACLMLSNIKFYSFKLLKIKFYDGIILFAVLLFLIWSIIFNYPIVLSVLLLYILISIFKSSYQFAKTC